MRTPLVAVPLTAALLGLAGCGGDDTSTSTPSAAGAAASRAAGASTGAAGQGQAAPVPDVDVCALLKPAEVAETMGVTAVTGQDNSAGERVECVWAPAEELPSVSVNIVSTTWERSSYAVSGIEPEDGFLGADRGGLTVRDPKHVYVVAAKGDAVLQLLVSGELFDDEDDALLDDHARALATLALGRL